MDTCGRYGKLYVYFLTIAKEVIYERLHGMGFPKDGKAMYEYLKRENKIQLIKHNPHLSSLQKEILLPVNGIINVEKVDITMYAQIYILLGHEKPFMLFMIKIRNFLCHLSLKELRDDLSERDLRNNWKLFTNEFIRHNVDRSLLNRCERDILSDNLG